MSELSITELQAENVELLPARETLGLIVVTQIGGSAALQEGVIAAVNKSVSVQSANVAVGSFNFLGF
jgi:hypothetical protein